MMKSVVLCLLAVAMVASATTLSGDLTADNGFVLYLSTSPTVTGTLVTSGAAWWDTFSFSGVDLTPGTTYYLQIYGFNTDGPGSILGSFNLSDSSFQFASGTQSLITDTTDWTYSDTGFDLAPLHAPTSYGVNGVGPWGPFFPAIDPNAQWIWNSNEYAFAEFFVTTITPLTGAIPEPTSMGLLGGGLVALGLLARRKRST
jgi:hypothetical protein